MTTDVSEPRGDRSVRERMLNLLHGELPDEAVVAPLAESDYTCFIKGSQWPTDAGSLEDEIATAEACGYDPIFETKIDYAAFDPELKFETTSVKRTEIDTRREGYFHTPKGDMHWVTLEKPGLVPYLIEGGISRREQFPIVEWYVERIEKCAELVRESVEATMKRVGDLGIVRTQVGNTFELFFCKYPDILFLYMDDPSAYLELAQRYFAAQEGLMKAALEAGTDLLYASGVGAELMSPTMFEETFLPLLKRQRKFVHAHGGLFYYHSCGRTLPFIERGYYNEILPDLFETLAPPPLGTIGDLRAAREMLDPRICTKGNFNNEILRTGSREEIVATAESIVDATWGYRHMVALSDSVLYGTPVENIQLLVEASRKRHRSKLA